MTLDEFRIYHSEIIEQFQWLEYNLKRILSKQPNRLDMDKMDALEKENIGQLIQRIKNFEKKNQINILTEEDYIMLEKMRERRNYWCHQCYLDIVVKKDEHRKLVVRKDGMILGLKMDLRDIESLQNKIEELYFNLFRNIRN